MQLLADELNHLLYRERYQLSSNIFFEPDSTKALTRWGLPVRQPILSLIGRVSHREPWHLAPYGAA